MSELKVDRIEPALANKITLSPSVSFENATGLVKFLVDSTSVTVTGPLKVGTTIGLETAGTSRQILTSQGPSLPPIWTDNFPIGGIIMWSGNSATVPNGWAICDGENNTPNLTNKFVVGVGTQFGNTSVKATGGSPNAVVVQHTHTDDGTFANHRHQYLLDDNTQGYEPNIDNIRIGSCINSGGAEGGGCLVSDLTSRPKTAANVSITSIGISNAGESGTNKNLPPYMALYYIMKVS